MRQVFRRTDGAGRQRVSVGARVAAAGLVALGACASPGYPPGGPPRLVPPRLIAVAPETLAVNARPHRVEFTFDEVTNEASRGGGAAGGIGGGATGLESAVLVSPRNGSVAVDWGGDRIFVRQRRGFRPNVTYTVTILAGLADLRNNARDSAVIAVFSTGGAIARGELRGVVFDWVNGRTAPSAVVEAVAVDSVPYVALADSTGRFVIPNIPLGTYLVRAGVDVNGNRAIDPREPYDTTRAPAVERVGPPVFTRPISLDTLEAELRVPVDSTAPRTRPRRPARAGPVDTTTPALALYAFVHDSTAPRVGIVSVSDSVTLRLAFDRSLRPDQPFTAAQVRVVAADSTVVGVREVVTAAADSAVQAQARAAADTVRRDSTRARRDSTPVAPNAPGTPRPPATPAAATPPRPTGPRLLRPVPPQELVVRLDTPVRPNAIYRITVRDIRSLSGVGGTTTRTFTTPRPPQPPPARSVPARPTPSPTVPSQPAPSAPTRPGTQPPTRGP